MKDGIYIEFFAVKDGTRYNADIISVDNATKILTSKLLDGIQELLMGTEDKEKNNA